ncbi:HIF-1 transcription factor component sima isoform X1 [Megalopta genalis]|uniref:HIF-1 transcription factor component sima isoform X1 n=1 Tax=Megalopta genalis TaxID=115081 RepID=UPI003FD5A8FF
MTVPRVQPLDRLPENQSGRCSDWLLLRQSGYPIALPPCRFDGQPAVQKLGNVMSIEIAPEMLPEMLPKMTPEMALYDVSQPCTGSAACIEELPSFCSQFSGCSVNNGSSAPRSCPIDVEDLALCFEPDKQQANCLPQRFGASAANYRRVKAKYPQYPAPLPDKGLSAFGGSIRDCRMYAGYGGSWADESFCNGCPQSFGFCSEEQWLQCPASDRCPIFGTSYSPYATDLLPPCAYEDFRNDCWQYGCNEDEQLLEDYLSNEKRKEKSRDAARYRRSKETDIFTELATALPIPTDQAAHLDKASVMRLAIAYLKVRSVVETMPPPLAKSETSTQMDKMFSEALNGFMLVLSNDGNMIYLSENVSDYLGVTQMDMMGQSVYEYSHPCDHDELRECLSSKPSESNEKRCCSFFLRLKCTLTSKGRKVNLKSASYKVIHCTGRLTYIREPAPRTLDTDDKDRTTEEDGVVKSTGASLVLVGCPIPHPSNIEIPLGRHTFLSKHSLSMKFTYADEKLAEYLGWNSEELMGQSVFEFYHALDNLALDKSFKSLFSKGQCETVAYRFLGKRGGYAWVVTQATLIHCSKQQKPLSVVCVNYILSGVEREDEVYSVRQQAARDTEPSLVKSEKLVSSSINETAEKEQQQQQQQSASQQPAATKLRLQVQVTGGTGDTGSTGSEDLEERAAIEPAKSEFKSCGEAAQKEEPIAAIVDPVKPLAVTTSTFRAAVPKPKKEPAGLQDGSRKDNTFPRPVRDAEKSFVGVQALKDSLEESLKENDEPKRKLRAARPFIFQGKPALEYNPKAKTVTRQLFVPISPQQQQQQQQQQEQITCRPPPQTATASIFAPRTEDMNKGFLTFSEDQPGLTMLKDEPEDLTHLAPTPGDVCVPLEDTPFLTDMLDEFILSNDNYCPLLSPGAGLATELRSTDFGDPLKDTDLSDTRNKGLGESLADSDPFMYGDSPSSPCSIDPNSVSPSLVKYRQSPERSIDSLGSPTGGSGAEGLSEDEMLMLGLSDSIADDELALRAPYIPMSDQDEALDLLISDDMVMWSPPQTTEKSCPKWMLDEKDQRMTDSSLAQLLKTDQVVSRKYNDHGGGLVNPVQVLGQIPRKHTGLDVSHWAAKLDRPNKRIHTASLDTGTENKRIKCDESSRRGGPLVLEDHLLGKQQPSMLRKPVGMGGSQLLRRLVSQQTVQRSNGVYQGDCFTGGPRRNDVRSLGMNDSEGDSGGGGCEGGGGGDGTQSGSERTSVAGCNSVLMNLLVSGCDENLMESRNVPTSLSKSLTTPLSVNLDNQMVPQCPASGGSTGSYDQLSPDSSKRLSGTFISEGSLVSPSSTMINFENFDYDPSLTSSGLLQVQPDLFGTLLDRELV